jgi:lipooligosaccharide transport system ATP-binding protein
VIESMVHGEEPVVRARKLVKAYGGQQVVRGIDLSVPGGCCFGFLGPNGAGKTTTLRMILGLTAPGSGELSIFGQPLPAAGPLIRQRVGVVPQIDNLDPDFTVEENLRIHASYFGIDRATIDRRIPDLLDFVELRGRADSRIQTLSGGMKRRLTIARALVNDPDLIVLDEPTTGLDPQARHLIWARLRDLLQRGKGLLLTTHYMEEAERLCDRLVVMDRGEILAEGSPRDLIDRHCPGEVIEIRSGAEEAAARLADCGGCRLEKVGDTLYAYTTDARPLVERLKGDGRLVYLHRPTSLEDLFLHLTGRAMRD